MNERERWMTAVQARLERVTTVEDLSPVLEETALEEAANSRGPSPMTPAACAMYLLGWLHWYRYHALPEGRDQQDLQAAVTMFTPASSTG